DNVSHLLCDLSFTAGLLSWIRAEEVRGRRFHSSGLFLHPDNAHDPGSRHRSLRQCDLAARAETSGRQTQTNRALDISALALCFGHGCCRLRDALSNLSFALRDKD